MAGRLRAKQIGALRWGRHGDGGTLFLVVEPGGRSRRWVQRLTIAGQRRDLGLGGYPYVGLAEARAAALSNRQLARRGGNPTAALRPSRVPTFRTACERVAAAATWKDHGPEDRRRALAWRLDPLLHLLDDMCRHGPSEPGDPLPEGLRTIASEIRDDTAEIRADIKRIFLQLTPVAERRSPSVDTQNRAV